MAGGFGWRVPCGVKRQRIGRFWKDRAGPFCEPVQRPAETINYRLAALTRPTALFSPQPCPIHNRAKRIGVYGLVQESIRATFGRQLFKLQISIPANQNYRRLSAY